MRTTIRIEDDLLSQLKVLADRRGVSLTAAVNTVLRHGLGSLDHVADEPRHTESTFSLGEPAANLDKALQIAGALEDQETLRKLLLRK